MTAGPNPKLYGLLVGVAILGGGALNYFAYTKVEANQKALETIKLEEQASAKVPERLKQSQANLTSTREGLHHLEQGVSGQAYVPTMMQELEDLGNSCGVTVTAVRPAVIVPTAPTAKDKPAANNPYDTIDLEVRGTGHFTDALRFVRALDGFPKVVEARAISLEKAAHADSKSTSGSPELAMTIQLRAYLFKSDTARSAMKVGGVHAG